MVEEHDGDRAARLEAARERLEERRRAAAAEQQRIDAERAQAKHDARVRRKILKIAERLAARGMRFVEPPYEDLPADRSEIAVLAYRTVMEFPGVSRGAMWRYDDDTAEQLAREGAWRITIYHTHRKNWGTRFTGIGVWENVQSARRPSGASSPGGDEKRNG